MRLYLLFLYNQIFLSHHPRVFALFLFWKRKTALKEKQARGRENPSFPRTNRSIAPTVNSTESLKKSFIHFSPVAVPANRRLSRKTARELPVCPKNGKAVFPKNRRSLAEFRPRPLAQTGACPKLSLEHFLFAQNRRETAIFKKKLHLPPAAVGSLPPFFLLFPDFVRSP